MKILDLCPYWVYPPNSGGSIRVYNLNKELSKKFDVIQVSSRARMTSKKNFFKGNLLKINENYYEHQYSNLPVLLTSYILYKFHLPFDILQSSILNKFRFFQLGQKPAPQKSNDQKSILKFLIYFFRNSLLRLLH